jgi:hypothetical protein
MYIIIYCYIMLLLKVNVTVTLLFPVRGYSQVMLFISFFLMTLKNFFLLKLFFCYDKITHCTLFRKNCIGNSYLSYSKKCFYIAKYRYQDLNFFTQLYKSHTGGRKAFLMHAMHDATALVRCTFWWQTAQTQKMSSNEFKIGIYS